MFIDRTGEKRDHPKYGLMEIVNYRGYDDCDILFHRTNNIVNLSYRSFIEVCASDPKQQLVFGVGKSYSEIYKIRSDGKKTPQYAAWENMLMRCYYEKTSRYSAYGGKGVKVSEDWLIYENFAKWFDDNYIEGYHLDKDLLGDGSLYSKDNCCYIPQKLNGVFVITTKNVGRHNKELPTGVVKVRKAFIVRVSHEVPQYSKSHSTVEAAHRDYLTRKWNSVRDIATEMYRWTEITERVYQAVLDKCYKEQEILRAIP